MSISLAPDPATTAPVDPTKPKPATPAAPIGLAPPVATAGTPATPAPLANEYPSAPSTTGTPQNRLQLAQTAFDTFAQSTAPQYTADLRQATQAAAGQGQIGSGGLRTTYGNLANQRALALDTERQNLVNAATTGTIADQQAAQGLNIQQQNADTAKLSATGNLALGQGQLSLAQGEAVGSVNGQQTLAAQTAAQQNAIATAGLTGVLNGNATLQAKQDAVNQAVAQGQLTVQQGQLALSTLANSQQNTIATGQLALATAAQDLQSKVAMGQLSIAQAAQALDEKVKTGELSVDQANQALAAINSSAANAVAAQNANTAQAAQQSTAANQAGTLQLQRDQLTQAGTQFGLSQAQSLKLAQLADATQNRQIDVSTQQGQNALLLQLANIIGGPAGSLDPAFVQTIMQALGFAYTPPGAPPGTGTGNTGDTGARTAPGTATDLQPWTGQPLQLAPAA